MLLLLNRAFTWKPSKSTLTPALDRLLSGSPLFFLYIDKQNVQAKEITKYCAKLASKTPSTCLAIWKVIVHVAIML